MTSVKRNQIENAKKWDYRYLSGLLSTEISKISDETLEKLVCALENAFTGEGDTILDLDIDAPISYDDTCYNLIRLNTFMMKNDFDRYRIDLALYDRLHHILRRMMIEVHERFEKVLNESYIEKVIPYYDKDTLVKELTLRLSVTINSLLFKETGVYTHIRLIPNSRTWQMCGVKDGICIAFRGTEDSFVTDAQKKIFSIVKDYVSEKNATILDILFVYRTKWKLSDDDELATFIDEIINRYTNSKPLKPFPERFIYDMMTLSEKAFEDYVLCADVRACIADYVDFHCKNDKDIIRQYMVDHGIDFTIDNTKPDDEDDSLHQDVTEASHNLSENKDEAKEIIAPETPITTDSVQPKSIASKDEDKVDWNYVKENLIIAAKQLEDVDFNDPESIRSSALYNYPFGIDALDTEMSSPIMILANSYRVYFSDLISKCKDTNLEIYYHGYGTVYTLINQFDTLITTTFININKNINDSDKVESAVKSFIDTINERLNELHR